MKKHRKAFGAVLVAACALAGFLTALCIKLNRSHQSDQQNAGQLDSRA